MHSNINSGKGDEKWQKVEKSNIIEKSVDKYKKVKQVLAGTRNHSSTKWRKAM